MDSSSFSTPQEKSGKRAIVPIVSVLATIGAGYMIFFYKDKNDNTFYSKAMEWFRNKGMTREQAISVIESFSKKKFANVDSYDTDYLIARAKAMKSKSPTFVVDDKIYDTKTGTVKK